MKWMENNFLAMDKIFPQLKSYLLCFSQANMKSLAWGKNILSRTILILFGTILILSRTKMILSGQKDGAIIFAPNTLNTAKNTFNQIKKTYIYSKLQMQRHNLRL